MLIPSLYPTSPRTRSLKPVRVPSDQNTRWRLPFHFSTNKKTRIPCLPHLPHYKIRFWGWMFSPRRRTRVTEWRLHWGDKEIDHIILKMRKYKKKKKKYIQKKSKNNRSKKRMLECRRKVRIGWGGLEIQELNFDVIFLTNESLVGKENSSWGRKVQN